MVTKWIWGIEKIVIKMNMKPHADETCVSKVKPVNNTTCHQRLALAMRLDVAALDVVCLLTCHMFTVFVLRWDMFYE